MRGRERAREIIWRNRGEELSTYTGRREGGRERERKRESERENEGEEEEEGG